MLRSSVIYATGGLLSLGLKIAAALLVLYGLLRVDAHPVWWVVGFYAVQATDPWLELVAKALVIRGCARGTTQRSTDNIGPLMLWSELAARNTGALMSGFTGFYPLTGARLGRGVRVSPQVVITDPFMVSIGDGSVIGMGSKLFGHITSDVDDGCTFGRIDIGPGVLVGVDCVIWPRVSIGANARILPKSVVGPGTVVGPGEVWAGIPARRVR